MKTAEKQAGVYCTAFEEAFKSRASSFIDDS